MLLPAEAIHEPDIERRDLFRVAIHDLIAHVHRLRPDEVEGKEKSVVGGALMSTLPI